MIQLVSAYLWKADRIEASLEPEPPSDAEELKRTPNENRARRHQDSGPSLRFGPGTPRSGPGSRRSGSASRQNRQRSEPEPETKTITFGSFNGLNQPGVINEGVVPNQVTRSRTLIYDGIGRLRRASQCCGVPNRSLARRLAWRQCGPRTSCRQRLR